MGLPVRVLEQGELLWAWALRRGDGEVRVLRGVAWGELRAGGRACVLEGSRLWRGGCWCVCERELCVRWGVCGRAVRALRGVLVWRRVRV